LYLFLIFINALKDTNQQKMNSEAQSYENLFLSTNLDTEYEDESLSDENNENSLGDCEEETLTLADLVANKTQTNKVSSNKWRRASSGSVSSSASSSASLKTNRLIRKKIKKMSKKDALLRKTQQLARKSPDHLKNYQYFEKDDDDDDEDAPREQEDADKKQKAFNLDKVNSLGGIKNELSESDSDSDDDDDDDEDDFDESDSEDDDEFSENERDISNLENHVDQDDEESIFGNHNHRGEGDEFDTKSFSVSSNQNDSSSTGSSNDSFDSSESDSNDSLAKSSNNSLSETDSNDSNTSLKNYKPPAPVFIDKNKQKSDYSFRTYFSNVTNTFGKASEPVTDEKISAKPVKTEQQINEEKMEVVERTKETNNDTKDVASRLKYQHSIENKIQNGYKFYGGDGDDGDDCAYEKSFDNFYATNDYSHSLGYESQSNQYSNNQDNIIEVKKKLTI